MPHSGIGIFASPHRPEKLSRSGDMERYARNPAGSTYSEMAAYLGNRPQRRLAANKTLRRVGNDIHVVLHQSPVVIAHPDGGFTVNHHGYNTRTTHQTIRDYSPAHTSMRKGGLIGGPHTGEREFDGPTTVDSAGEPVGIEPRHMTADVIGIARGIKSTGDYSRLPVLGDALQDAGVSDEHVINHTRDPNRRSSWLVDHIAAMGTPEDRSFDHRSNEMLPEDHHMMSRRGSPLRSRTGRAAASSS